MGVEPLQTRVDPSPKSAKTDAAVGSERNAPPWVKVLVSFHLFAIVVWTLPFAPPAVTSGERSPIGAESLLLANQRHFKTLIPIRAYLLGTGMWQYWDMFAPNPSTVDFFATVEIVYRDGRVQPFPFPRIYDASLPAKYLLERYRKFFERVRVDDNRVLWPAFARRVAYLAAKDPSDPPARVRITRNWRVIAPPGAEQTAGYQSYTFYDEPVDQNRLREDKGW